MDKYNSVSESFKRVRQTTLLLLILFWPWTVKSQSTEMNWHDELIAKAAIVCNGVVLDMSNTGVSGKDKKTYPTTIWKAHLRILGVYKGAVSVGQEIELRFPQLDIKKVHVFTVTGMMPTWIDLQRDHRYRFFLRPVQDGTCLGALDGDFNEGKAAEPLYADEPDGSPPLFKKEAIGIANDYRQKWQPQNISSAPASSEASYFGSVGTIQFCSKPPLSYPAFTYDAEILVRNDRTIDPKSWIAAEFPRKGSKVTERDAGREVRITADTSNRFRIIRGVVEKVGSADVVVRYGSEDEEGKPGETVSIPKKDIDGMQTLIQTK
jgi:hypothetical protein